MKNVDVKNQIVKEIHKQARRNFKRRKVILRSLNDLFQADLVEMIPYARENNNYKYILIVINCFSKFVWAFPLKNKSAPEIKEAMEKVFLKQTPVNLHSDRGKEFFNSTFEKLVKKYNVNHYSTFSDKKASIVERVNRTLKNIMWKEFNLQGTYKWVNILPKIIKKYNNTKHRTIKMKPSEVKQEHERKLLDTVYNRKEIANLHDVKFKLGDHVRVSKYRGVFDKKYTPNWSTEIFTIKKIQLTNPITYLIKDVHGEDILGGFYREELQKVKHSDAYLVEKILKRKGDKVYVKWLGFDTSYNSWIHKNDVI